MFYDYADGARLNTILGKKVFKNQVIDVHEVQEAIGLSIEELVMCWLFDSSNNFQKVLSEWRDSNTLMNFEEIQGY